MIKFIDKGSVNAPIHTIIIEGIIETALTSKSTSIILYLVSVILYSP
jgi:hypothetical protein